MTLASFVQPLLMGTVPLYEEHVFQPLLILQCIPSISVIIPRVHVEYKHSTPLLPMYVCMMDVQVKTGSVLL